MFLVQEVKRLDCVKGWNPTFQMLNLETRKHVEHLTLKVARLPDNRSLNRYRDVLPYDQSRVSLDSVKDYINANFVEASEVGRRYILTQGPLPHTCSHFWQMVWEQNSSAIVMLNRVIEKNTVKCHPYWPLGEDEVAEFGPFRVKNQSELMASAYVVRELQLEDMISGNKRTIKQFHYMLWPDFGVPASPNSFLDFLQDVKDSGAMNDDTGPPVVHCSAGIGRSGTFCLVDTALAKVEKAGTPDGLDIRQILLNLRRYRVGLIQTAEQLRFSFIAIVAGIKRLLPDEFDEDILNADGQEQTLSQSDDDAPPPLPPRRTGTSPPREAAVTNSVTNGMNLEEERRRQRRLAEKLSQGLDDSSEGTEEEVSDISDSDDEVSLEDVEAIIDGKSPPSKPLPPLPTDDVPQRPTKPLPAPPPPPEPPVPERLLPTYDSEEENNEEGPAEKKIKTDDELSSESLLRQNPSKIKKLDCDNINTVSAVADHAAAEDGEAVPTGSKASESSELRRRQREVRKTKTNELVDSIKRRWKEEEIKVARRRLWTKTAIALGLCAGIFLLIRWFS